MSNAERFITPELKEKEALILEAEEKSSLLEYELFVAVREEVKTYTEQLQELAKAVATIDVLQSFSTVKLKSYQLVRPTISLMDRSLEIIDGRHPVVEKVMGRSSYVPNSIQMTPEDLYFINYRAKYVGEINVYETVGTLCDSFANWVFCSCDKCENSNFYENLYTNRCGR